jgi:ubiquinone/menaquinone biosynthesis C-methylase UbiE
MASISDGDYLLRQQYRTGANLNARIALHTRFSTNRIGWYRWFFDLLSKLDARAILEVGSGTGKLWSENLDRIPDAWSITLSDLSAGMLDGARSALGEHADRFTYAIVDAQDIPYASSSFDTVIANFMLYHVANREGALMEMRRVLLPGGRLLCTLNGRRHMQEVRSMLEELGTSFFDDAERFTLEDAEALIQAQFRHVKLHRYPDGLEVTEVEPLIDYVLSTAAHDALMRDGRLEALRARIEKMLAEQGRIHVTKDSGTFEAW